MSWERYLVVCAIWVSLFVLFFLFFPKGKNDAC
jgi:hypothetical protein